MARKCGKCGETGHNRKTCGQPKVKKEKVKRVKVSMTGKHPDGYYAVTKYNKGHWSKHEDYARPEGFTEFPFDVGNVIEVTFPWESKELILVIEDINYKNKNVSCRELKSQKSYGFSYGKESMEHYGVAFTAWSSTKKKRRRKKRKQPVDNPS